jgi:dTDP-glucose 4,6-dehydratase
MLMRAYRREPLPVHGMGRTIQDWLHVDDHAAALWALAERGRAGGHYLIGGNAQHSELEVVRGICHLMDLRFPTAAPHAQLIAHLQPSHGEGHGLRQAIDTAKLRRDLRWAPSRSFRAGLAETVDWYLAHEGWWSAIDGRVQGGRRLDLLERAAS